MRAAETTPTPQPTRLRRSRILGLVLLALAAAVGVMAVATRGEQRRMRRELGTQVGIAAAGLDLNRVARLRGSPADETAPDYQGLKTRLAAMRRAVPSCRFVYVLGRRSDGVVFFYADSEPSSSPDCSPAGQTYEEVAPEIWAMFDNRRPLVCGPNRDRWGVWMSALIPLTLPDSGGRVVALGMDVRANDWRRVLLWRLAPALVAAVIAITLMVFLILLGLRMRAEKNRIASHATVLRESETLFRSIAEQLRDAVFLTDLDGRFTYVSPAMETVTGYPGQLLRYRPLEALFAGDQETQQALLQAMAAGTDVPTRELALLRPDGEQCRLEVSASPLRHGGIVVGMIGLLRDITQRWEEARRVALSETKFAATFHYSPVAAAIVEEDSGELIDVNPSFETLTGYCGAAGAACLRGLELLCDPADRARLQDELLASGEIRQTPTEIRTASGAVRQVLFSAAHLPVGDRSCLLLRMQDLTQLRAAEASLRQRETFVRSIFRVAPIGLAVGTGRIHEEANAAWCAITGYSPEELIGVSADLLYASPEESARTAEEVAGQLRERGSCQVETRWRRKDGQLVDVLVCATWTDPEGDSQSVTYAAVDITERRRAEAALQESRRIAWTLLDANQDGALLLDPSGVIEGANAGAAAFLQVPLAGLIGRPLAQLLPPSLASRRLSQVARARELGAPVIEGEEYEGRALSVAVHPVAEDGGAVTALALFLRDITDLRRAEDAQRMASLGQLAAGVAHEFNNLLCAISMHASLAHQVRSPETLDNAYHNIREASSRGSAICDSLLGFARPLEPVYSVVPATAPLDAALALSKPQLTSGQVTVERDYDPQTPPLWADSSQLEQVYLNLIVNACHAMPQGGALKLRVRPDPDDEQGTVLVQVSDSGHGIAPEHLPHLFDPFFTTKGALGQSHTAGTGLGLSVSRGIVLAHGGDIRVESTPGQGATFELRLPACAPAHLPATGVVQESLPLPGGANALAGRQLLLVEDEQAIREATADFMAAMGVAVTAVGDADSAIALLRERPFDVVVTDLMMPGGGLSVVRTVAALAQPPALLVITGRLNSQLESELLAAGAGGVLAKPFGPAELLQAVQRLLGH